MFVPIHWLVKFCYHRSVFVALKISRMTTLNLLFSFLGYPFTRNWLLQKYVDCCKDYFVLSYLFIFKSLISIYCLNILSCNSGIIRVRVKLVAGILCLFRNTHNTLGFYVLRFLISRHVVKHKTKNVVCISGIT